MSMDLVAAIVLVLLWALLCTYMGCRALRSIWGRNWRHIGRQR